MGVEVSRASAGAACVGEHQCMIDLVHLTGREEDIVEGLEKLYEAGVRTVAPGSYTIIDKKGLLREIGSKIMPHFRN